MLDAKESGVFSVDLKENVHGAPCITEINAGRFSSATNFFDLVGRHNMAKTFVRLALGNRVEIEHSYDAAPDWYMLRDIDAAPRIFHASEFSDNVVSAWQSSGSRRGRKGNGKG